MKLNMRETILVVILIVMVIFTILNYINLMNTINEIEEELEREEDCYYRNDCFNITPEIKEILIHDVKL